MFAYIKIQYLVTRGVQVVQNSRNEGKNRLEIDNEPFIGQLKASYSIFRERFFLKQKTFILRNSSMM